MTDVVAQMRGLKRDGRLNDIGGPKFLESSGGARELYGIMIVRYTPCCTQENRFSDLATTLIIRLARY